MNMNESAIWEPNGKETRYVAPGYAVYGYVTLAPTEAEPERCHWEARIMSRYRLANQLTPISGYAPAKADAQAIVEALCRHTRTCEKRESGQ